MGVPHIYLVRGCVREKKEPSKTVIDQLFLSEFAHGKEGRRRRGGEREDFDTLVYSRWILAMVC